MKLVRAKTGWLFVLLLASALVSGCFEISDELTKLEDDRGEKTYTKQLELQNETIVEAKVTFNLGIKLAIGGEEVVVSEDVFANLDPSEQPKIDLHVTEQEGRANKIILLAVETEDPEFGSQIYLWGFEYYSNQQRLRKLWELDRDSVEMSYQISKSSHYFALQDGDYYELELEHFWFLERFAIDELPGLDPVEGDYYRGTLALSPPIDFMLDDLIIEGQRDVIVRHKVVGYKPEWFPYDYVMKVYTTRSSQLTSLGSYGSSEEILYSHKELLPTYTATYDKLSADEPLIIVEANTKLDRSSVDRALLSTLTSNDPQRTVFDYDLTWKDEDQKVTIRFNDARVGEVIHFEFDQVRNWLGKRVKKADITTPNKIVFSRVEEQMPYVHVADVRTMDVNIFDAPLASQIYIAEDMRDATKKIFLTSDEGPLLLEPTTGELQLPFAYESEDYEPFRWINYYPDRFFETANFVIENLTTLYRYDDGRKTHIWSAPENRVVYGFAISPAGKRIAILYNQEEWKGSYANLLLLDPEGNELATVTEASFSHKSDGIIPKIALEWTDEQTVHIPTSIVVKGLHENGTRVVTLQGDGSVTIDEVIDEDEYSETLLDPSPTGDYVVEHSRTQLIMLVNQQQGERTTLGSGHFLGWIDEHRAAWYVSSKEGFPERDFIF